MGYMAVGVGMGQTLGYGLWNLCGGHDVHVGMVKTLGMELWDWDKVQDGINNQPTCLRTHHRKCMHLGRGPHHDSCCRIHKSPAVSDQRLMMLQPKT